MIRKVLLVVLGIPVLFLAIVVGTGIYLAIDRLQMVTTMVDESHPWYIWTNVSWETVDLAPGVHTNANGLVQYEVKVDPQNSDKLLLQTQKRTALIMGVSFADEKCGGETLQWYPITGFWTINQGSDHVSPEALAPPKLKVEMDYLFYDSKGKEPIRAAICQTCNSYSRKCGLTFIHYFQPAGKGHWMPEE